jgi:hypothetical protein
VSLKHLFYSASFKGMTLDTSRGDIRYALSDPDFNKNCLETVLRLRRITVMLKHSDLRIRMLHNPRTLNPSCSRAWAFRIPMSWRSGYQVCGNERPVYTELIAGFYIGIWGGARPFQVRGGSIKQNESFETSQELKGRSKKIKKLVAVLS